MDTATAVIFQICMHAERKKETACFKPVFSIIFYMDGVRTNIGLRMEDYIAFVI